MTEGIGKTSLTMGTPWRVVVGGLFDIGRPGLHSPLYELIGSSDENFDPVVVKPASRAPLLPYRHGFVEKNGAPPSSSPATPPKSHSSPAPSAV